MPIRSEVLNMANSDKLHELIHSLTMSEKRYFNLFAHRHTIGEKNNYIILFELLEEMEELDTESLQKQLSVKSIPIKHLASDKNYLYNLILKSLSAYHSGKSASLQIKEINHQVELLYNKGLYHHCLSLIKKAKRLSKKFDLYALGLESLFWERKAYGNLGMHKKAREALEEAIQQLAIMDNLYVYQKLYYGMIGLRARLDKARSQESRKEVMDFMEYPNLQESSLRLSSRADLYFWHVYAMFYYVTDQKQEEIGANEKLLEIMEKDEDYLMEYPHEFVNAHFRLLSLNRLEEDLIFQQKLSYLRGVAERFKRGGKKIKSKIYSLALELEITRLIETGRFIEALELLPEIEKLFKQYGKYLRPSSVLTHTYMRAYILVANAKYREALPSINKIINELDTKVRPSLHVATRFLNLVAHFELGNERLIRYLIDGTSRFLKKTKRLYQLENATLKLFKQLAKCRNDGQRNGVFIQIKGEMEEILEDPLERKALAYFDIISWINSHIESRPWAKPVEKGLVK